jgi:hypothetical protein
VTDRITLINELESLLKQCFDTIDNLRSYQQIKENDVRVTFFKHLVNVLDSTILFLIVARKYFGNENWWKEYNLSIRPFPFSREFDYYDQVVTNSFCLFIISSFESSIRLIIKRYDSNLYQSQRDFNPLCKELISKLNLYNKDKFIDVILTVRNGIHNNGVYIPRGHIKNKKIEWNNVIFHFDENKPISITWSNLVSFSKEIYKIFTDIINSNQIKKIAYYHDPIEPIR